MTTPGSRPAGEDPAPFSGDDPAEHGTVPEKTPDYADVP